VTLNIQIFSIFIFILLGLSLIFLVKTRISNVIILLAAHLALILFFSLSITNYTSFKEIVLTIIVYLITAIFLISQEDEATKIKAIEQGIIKKIQHFSSMFFIIITGFLMFFLMFFCVKKSFDKINFESYKATEAAQVKGFQDILQVERKKIKLQKKLKDNFLLKRSSDVILIIVIASSIFLILSNKNIQKNEYL
jgi:hypothetical protein